MTAEWNYNGENGPEHWSKLCERFAVAAEFQLQSPIPLSNSEISETMQKETLQFFYQSEEFIEQQFNHSFHFIPPEAKSFVRFEEVDYHLTDIHFHLPSEHTLENKVFPIEFHFVHMCESGTNLVIGVLFEIAADQWNLKEMNWDKEQHRAVFNPRLFIPEENSFFHYIGSLTTPPTKGPIQWFVFDTVHEIPADFVNALKKSITPNNKRPLQAIQQRVIKHSN